MRSIIKAGRIKERSDPELNGPRYVYSSKGIIIISLKKFYISRSGCGGPFISSMQGDALTRCSRPVYMVYLNSTSRSEFFSVCETKFTAINLGLSQTVVNQLI